MQIDIKKLSIEEKRVLLACLEVQLGLKVTDTEKTENPFLVESRKCNEIAKMKKLGKSIIFTELQ